MKWNLASPQTRLNISSALILCAGLASSIYIYLTAGNITDSVLEYEETKKYVHDLELYGGKANVLAVELTKWFHGLWHGQSLAYTIACISIFISFGFFLVAYDAPSDVESDDFSKSRQGGSEKRNSCS